MTRTLYRVSAVAVLLFAIPAVTFSGTRVEESGEQTGASVYEIDWLGPGFPFEPDSRGEIIMEEAFNIKINSVQIDTDTEWEKITLRFATGWTPDVLDLSSNARLAELVQNGVLSEIPVDMIRTYAPNYYEIVTKIDPMAFRLGSINGANYTLPKGISYNRPLAVAIRADWLEAVGSGLPRTIEDLEKIFIKFRNNDPDGNGRKDTYGMTGNGMDGRVTRFTSIFGAYGTQPFLWMEKDGRIVHGFTLSKNALKLLNRWYEMELIDPEWVTTYYREDTANDVPFMFAGGRVGYIDNQSFDDYQWDNGGHVNAKWVSLNPGWTAFFDDSANANVLAPYLDFPEKTGQPSPGPVYINIDPPIGPEGSGTFSNRILNSHIAMGKKVEGDEGRIIKILEIFDRLNSDEDLYVKVQFGPEGETWQRDENGYRVWKPEWERDPDFERVGRVKGYGMYFNPTYAMNPDFLNVFGGKAPIQRYQMTMPPLTDHPALMNAVPVSLPSQTDYLGDLTRYIEEYITKAIVGELDIEATFDDAVATFMKNGGTQLTREANEWYNSAQ